MYIKLNAYINQLTSGFEEIPSSRKNNLRKVAEYIQSKLREGGNVRLNFICTHNSRRSHLAQIWATVAAHYYNISNFETFSGGTEATAFNPRAVDALKRAGFRIENPGGENPKYKVSFSEEADPLICFSKTFDSPVNPQGKFAAIMTCSDADENCPFIPGAEFRASITYQDPKESDGTNEETHTYDERCKQISTEMFFMMSLVNK